MLSLSFPGEFDKIEEYSGFYGEHVEVYRKTKFIWAYGDRRIDTIKHWKKYQKQIGHKINPAHQEYIDMVQDCFTRSTLFNYADLHIYYSKKEKKYCIFIRLDEENTLMMYAELYLGMDTIKREYSVQNEIFKSETQDEYSCNVALGNWFRMSALSRNAITSGSGITPYYRLHNLGTKKTRSGVILEYQYLDSKVSVKVRGSKIISITSR